MNTTKIETIEYFTEKEEEFVNLLAEIGTPLNVARLLVFLARTPEATSREIERGTDLRQPEISLGMKFLTARKWVKARESKGKNKGRPVVIYQLAKPLDTIIDAIRKEKEKEAEDRLVLVKKLRDFI